MPGAKRLKLSLDLQFRAKKKCHEALYSSSQGKACTMPLGRSSLVCRDGVATLTVGARTRTQESFGNV